MGHYTYVVLGGFIALFAGGVAGVLFFLERKHNRGKQ
jgi:hypothetical protein